MVNECTSYHASNPNLPKFLSLSPQWLGSKPPFVPFVTAIEEYHDVSLKTVQT